MQNPFVWADLSTFDLSGAKHFYRECFGWRYHEQDAGYVLAGADPYAPVAGLYTMPEKFQAIGMPSFWMSYIQVDDIDATVSKAEQHGARIEVRPEPSPSGGLVALIRDPSGAGFTCFQGESGASRPKAAAGARVWHELHVSDLTLVGAFYREVFGWAIQPAAHADRYELFGADDSTPIAGIQVTSNELKGDKEYWGVYFALDDLRAAGSRVEQLGGRIVAEQPVGGRAALLVVDSQDAAFYLVQTSGGGQV
ncbi:MAG: VOC family protein [Pseudomonadota bacterium]